MLKINKLDKEKRQMNGKTIRQSHLLASEQVLLSKLPLTKGNIIYIFFF